MTTGKKLLGVLVFLLKVMVVLVLVAFIVAVGCIALLVVRLDRFVMWARDRWNKLDRGWIWNHD